MPVHSFNPLRSIVGLCTASVLVVTLAACGGGSDDSNAEDAGLNGSTNSSSTNSSSSSTTASTPATNPTTSLEQAGNLNYLVTNADGTTRVSPATVAYSAPNGTLTLDAGTADAFSVTTTNEWEDVNWAGGRSGTLKAAGNAGLVCTSTGGAVGISHNMQLVSNPLEVIKGKTFVESECDGGSVYVSSTTFNEDGTVTNDYGNGQIETVPASTVAAVFSDAGYSDADGSFKVRLYSWTTPNGQTGYYYVAVGTDIESGRTTKYVILGAQQLKEAALQ